MRFYILPVVLYLVVYSATAQTNGFPFGKVAYSELEMTSYPKDTSAVAVVLNEFGEAYIENGDDFNLIFKHHIKIKILKKGGLKYADFEIPLKKYEPRRENLTRVEASTFNIVNGAVREVKFSQKNQFTEDINKWWDIAKITLPDVRVGSVIEIQYTMESPFVQTFRKWEFQSEIPKVTSEFWASMPGNYRYNIVLRGFLKLTKNESEIIKKCLDYGSANSDCSVLKCGIKDVPAFYDEEYMTARSNYLSAINFELAEIVYFDGRKDQFTKEWKDVELELRQDSKFGVQLKRGKDIIDEKVEQLIAGESDPLIKAQKIYEFMKGWYRWNENYSKYSELGIKKAFDSKVGNVGDINLSLIAALRYAGLSAEPVILSTRENGLAPEIHPVLTEFNYVIAKLNINNKVYLLDATEDYLSFGLIPERCLNGKGRVLSEKESYWYELNAPEKRKQVSIQKLKMDAEGVLRGTVQNTFFGYDAMNQRKVLSNFANEKEFIGKLSEGWGSSVITGYKIENPTDHSKPLIISVDVEIASEMGASPTQLFSPFLFERWARNPFRSSDRMYPVDFGVPIEEVVALTLEYPAGFEVDELPEKVGLLLPNGGGRYMFSIQNASNTLTMYSSLSINKAVFTSEEYHYLKELFNHVVATQQSELVLKKKM